MHWSTSISVLGSEILQANNNTTNNNKPWIYVDVFRSDLYILHTNSATTLMKNSQLDLFNYNVRGMQSQNDLLIKSLHC